jgi:hypothetical protein
MALPTKTEHLATLQPAVPSQEDGSWRTICRDPEWHYPEEEVVQAGPECSLHLFHKDCLLPCFTTTDTNLCPYCRRELFQADLEDDSYDSDGDNSDDDFHAENLFNSDAFTAAVKSAPRSSIRLTS